MREKGKNYVYSILYYAIVLPLLGAISYFAYSKMITSNDVNIVVVGLVIAALIVANIAISYVLVGLLKNKFEIPLKNIISVGVLTIVLVTVIKISFYIYSIQINSDLAPTKYVDALNINKFFSAMLVITVMYTCVSGCLYKIIKPIKKSKKKTKK